MAVVCIDTNLWYVALLKPTVSGGEELHRRCRELDAVLADPLIHIAISSYQVLEIVETLRKGRLGTEARAALLRGFDAPKYMEYEVTRTHVREALFLSGESGIHAYDCLVVLPLRGPVDRICSADDHFLHSHFTSIAPVENPVDPWMLREGSKPARGTPRS